MAGASTEHVAALAALQLVPGAGPVALRAITAAARGLGRSVGCLLGLPERELRLLFPPGSGRFAALAAACTADLRAQAEALLAACRAQEIMPLAVGSPGYPQALERFLGAQAPPLLFVRGQHSLLAGACAGVVGTRAPSAAGVELARACAVVFACAGIPVVSGGAAGIDSAAHAGALRAGGATVAVLPLGLLRYRLSPLFEEALAQGRLALVSHCVPDAPWRTHAAVARNATISALVRLLCVVEPKETGGSICTARHCLAQAKPVFHALASPPLGGGEHPLARAQPLLESGRLESRGLLSAWKRCPAPAPAEQTLIPGCGEALG